jgi:hypothetical protein
MGVPLFSMLASTTGTEAASFTERSMDLSQEAAKKNNRKKMQYLFITTAQSYWQVYSSCEKICEL